ncbi:MAG: hypothetical protein RJQ09_07190 [Cyclobacteriaceae bacterium]
MTRTSTPDDLIRYIYGETNKQEKEEIESGILCESETNDEFNDFIALKQDLEKIKEEPSRRSISKILDFSKGFGMKEVVH